MKMPDTTDTILWLTIIIFLVLILLAGYFYYAAGVEATEGSEATEN